MFHAAFYCAITSAVLSYFDQAEVYHFHRDKDTYQFSIVDNCGILKRLTQRLAAWWLPASCPIKALKKIINKYENEEDKAELEMSLFGQVSYKVTCLLALPRTEQTRDSCTGSSNTPDEYREIQRNLYRELNSRPNQTRGTEAKNDSKSSIQKGKSRIVSSKSKKETILKYQKSVLEMLVKHLRSAVGISTMKYSPAD